VKKPPLRVSLHAREPSVVELTVGDRVQLDRVTPSPHGLVAERHGRLLDPGVHTVALEAGHYLFRTLSDTHLRVVTGGIAIEHRAADKDPPPPPPLALDRGDELPGEPPSLTIE
jgi:hypothetical protein